MSFTHTYSTFCKLTESRNENEQLAQKLYEMYKKIITPQINFDEMNRKEIFNHQEKIQNELKEEIKSIFNNNTRIIIQEEKTTKLSKIVFNNYVYLFVYDSSVQNTAILIDFYPLTSALPTKTVKLPKFSQKYSLNNKIYYLANTYNAFCSYARYVQKPINRNLNESFFKSAKIEITNNSNNNYKQLQNNRFGYMMVGEYIILYSFKHN